MSLKMVNALLVIMLFLQVALVASATSNLVLANNTSPKYVCDYCNLVFVHVQCNASTNCPSILYPDAMIRGYYCCDCQGRCWNESHYICTYDSNCH